MNNQFKTNNQMKNKFINLEQFPDNMKFSLYLLTQDVSSDIKKKYIYFLDYPIIHILILLYTKKRKDFVFENDNYDEIIRNKLSELRKKINIDENRDLIQNIITDLAFYTNPEILSLWDSFFPEIYNRNYNYIYTWNPTINNYNLMKAAIEGNNNENILYLRKKYNFNFWENTNDSFKINKYLLNDISLLGDFSNANQDVILKIIDLIYNSNSKILINLFLKSNILNKKTNILYILESYITQSSDKIVNFIVNHEDFPFEFITLNEWSGILNDIYNYNISKLNFKHHSKTKIFNIIIKKIIDKKANIQNVIEYNIEILHNMIRLPNIISTLDLFINSINLDGDDIYNICLSLIKYGELETLEYFNKKFNLINLNGVLKYNMEEYITESLKNKNKKMLKYFLEINKFDSLYLNFSFIHTKENDNNKIKKLKLIDKHLGLEKYKIEIFNEINLNSNIKLIEWLLKKIFNNKIESKEDFSIIKNLFIIIVNKFDNKLLDNFINMIDSKFNLWELMPYILSYYSWFEHPTNILLKYCNSSQKLEDQSDILKESICEKMLLFNHTNCIYYCKMNNYLKILNILKRNKVDYKYIISKLNVSVYSINNELMKALLYDGFKFQKIYKEVCSKNYWYFQYYNFKSSICLYNLLRRIRIRKHITNKKKHLYNYKETIVNLETKPERNGEGIISRGSEIFYHNMDEVDSMYETNTIKYNYPIHLEPHKLVDLSKNHLWINQKTDGLTTIDIPQDNLFPSVSFEYIKMDGEYIKELDLYLVFGLRSYTRKHNLPIEDYNDLVGEHKLCRNFMRTDNYLDSYNGDYICNKLKTEAIEIIEFCSKYKSEKNKWYPKKVWDIIDPSLNLNVLNIIENYQNLVYSFCIKDTTMSGFLKQKEIKTDGIIIMKNKNQLYKYKQDRNMTADILFDKEIYRCYWNDGKWNPKELRLDKKYPNPKELVDKLTYYHNNKWNILDIIKYQLEMNIKEVYYQQNLQDYHFKQYSDFNKKEFNSIIKQNYNNINLNYLDLGCGFCNNILWKNPLINIDGIDIDISILEKQINKNKNIFICNIGSEWKSKKNSITEYYKKNKFATEKKYNIVIMNFSIQYVFKTNNGFKCFISELNNRTVKNSLLFVSMICLEQNIYLKNGSFINLIDSPIKYDDELIKNSISNWYRTFYSNRHRTPIKEPSVNLEGFIKLMNLNGWKIKKEFKMKENANIGPIWKKLYDNIKRLEFIKI